MAKKMLKKKVQRKPAVKNVAAPMVDSAREIWLAGLGAFNVAQQEGGRILEQGSKLFDNLVAEGSKVEKKARKDVEGAVGEIRNEMENRVEGVRKQADLVRRQAVDNWDKLEKIFEDRVARALAGLGIPSKEDVTNLSDKVQKLARQVADLDAGTATVKVSVKKTAVKKTRVKKVPAKKVPAKKVPAKKAPAKKAMVKKTTVKKTTARKPAKKSVTKKALSKKTLPKKVTPRKVAMAKTEPATATPQTRETASA